jgi:hypothetical protein
MSSGSTELEDVVCRDKVYTSGKLFAKDCDLPVVSTSGKSKIVSSKVKEFLGSGKTSFYDCHIGKISTSGKLKLENSHVEGDVKSSGKIRLDRSSIAGTLEATAEKIEICNSKVETILLKPAQTVKVLGLFSFFSSPKESLHQKVELSGKETEVGKIIFSEDCVGEVVLTNGANWKGTVVRV